MLMSVRLAAKQSQAGQELMAQLEGAKCQWSLLAAAGVDGF